MNLGEILSNKFIKIVVATFFFFFIYGIIYEIGVFLGWNEVVLDTYMMWIAVLVVLIVVLPIQKSFL
jgi:hypothetical protein